MNRKQGLIFWLGFLALSFCVLNPPYHRVNWENGNRIESALKFELIFNRVLNDDGLTSPIFKLDVTRLSTEELGIMPIATVSLITFSRKELDVLAAAQHLLAGDHNA